MTPELFALLRLVARFVQRQALPREVLLEMRPDLLGLTEERASRDVVRSSSHGRWGAEGEWSYRIHGHGCRMEHATTGERIEWDGPDLMRFDPYWFQHWLEWVFASGHGGADAARIAPRLQGVPDERHAQLRGLLDELVQAGVLLHHPDTTNMYELVAGR